MDIWKEKAHTQDVKKEDVSDVQRKALKTKENHLPNIYRDLNDSEASKF